MSQTESVAEAVLQAYREGLAEGRRVAEEEQRSHRAMMAQQLDALAALLGEDMNFSEEMLTDRLVRRLTLTIDVADTLYQRRDLKDLVQSLHQKISDGVARLIVQKAPGLLRHRPINHGWAMKQPRWV